MKNRAVFDIESNEWIDFLVLGFFDGEEFRTFSTIKLFLKHLEKRKYRGFTIYAHNGGKFDFLFLLDDMFELGWNIEFVERSGRIICLKVKTSKNNFIFSDSYALLPASLKNLGINFDVEHKKSEFEFNGRIKVTNKLLSYLENDCLCLYEVLHKFFNSDFVVEPKMTIASQALNTFQKRFLENSEIVKMKLKDENYFRENFYSGGRVEVFKGYGENVNVYDVNSLFPFAMLNEMPCGEYVHTRSFHKDLIGFYEVEMNFPAEYISPLLVKTEKKNYFVTGKGKYFLSSYTLNIIKKYHNVKFNVIKGFIFKKKDYLFNEYVEHYYKIKSETKDSTERYISKLFLNSLYGKFGQSRFNDTIQVYDKNIIDFSMFSEKYGLVLVQQESRSNFVLPYIASYITDISRALHYEMMLNCGNNLFYCDTDSIFTTKKLKTENKIGGLHLEGTYNGIFIGNKMYALKNKQEEKVKFKGFSTDEFSFSDFKKHLLTGKELVQTTERILSFRECINRKSGITKETGDFLKMVSTTKKATGEYDKRKKIKSKNHIFDTVAYSFTEIQEGNF
jgi:hypothetical protein